MARTKTINTVGKRKASVARATAKPGTGIIRINSRLITNMGPEIARLKLMEPVMLAGETAQKVDIKVNVHGGGAMGQADAARQAIALALMGFNKKLKTTFLDYDRSMLVSDPRRTEPHKPSRSSKGPRKHKQRSKR